MRIAIIDLGTNSVRFDIRESQNDYSTKTIYREKLMIRLGENLFETKNLSPKAISRAIQALKHFQNISKKFDVDKTIAFATSALRDAKNRNEFLKLVKKETNIKFKVISGKQEAYLIAQGILNNEKIPQGLFALVDIGGGSTEISICKNSLILFSHSFNLGTARLQQIFLKTSPPNKIDVLKLQEAIKNLLKTKIPKKYHGNISKIIASSGTARALSRLIKKSTTFNNKQLNKLANKLITLDTTQLSNLKNMEQRRVDIICAGAVLMNEIVKFLGTKTVQTTSYSLRDGMIIQSLNSLRLKLDFKEKSFSDKKLILIASTYFSSKNKISHSIYLAKKIFLLTKEVHKLNLKWFNLFKTAFVLRNIGEKISYLNHPIHSAYIIKNLNLNFFNEEEINFIAELCKFHEETKPEVNFNKKIFSKNFKKDFLKLLALLRIADALEIDEAQNLKLRNAKLIDKTLYLKAVGTSYFGLEQLRLEQKQPLFYEVFKIKIALY
jgi:exopolyphosphatase/guanosine-5'-triphosphate,3'-diphosphate pyrophosphatase